MKAIKAAEVSAVISAKPETIWRALTTPELLKSYFFGADVKTDWKVGHPITFSGTYKGKAFTDKGAIKTFDPGKELSFTHWSELSGVPDTPGNHHLVTIDLKTAKRSTTVTLTQENHDGKPVTEEAKAGLEKNWTTVVQGLKKVAES